MAFILMVFEVEYLNVLFKCLLHLKLQATIALGTYKRKERKKKTQLQQYIFYNSPFKSNYMANNPLLCFYFFNNT